MHAEPLRWHPIDYPGTFVYGESLTLASIEADRRYRIGAVRPVVFPSVAGVLDRAVAAADLARRGRAPPDAGAELRTIGHLVPPDDLVAMAERRPEMTIPFLRSAGTYLAPLQLIGEVHCLRLYDLTVPGAVIGRLYGGSAATAIAPEATLTPAVVRAGLDDIRYLDIAAEGNPLWLPSPLVLISNAAVRPDGYHDLGPAGCDAVAHAASRFPVKRCGDAAGFPRLPENHMDWGIALLMLYAWANKD